MMKITEMARKLAEETALTRLQILYILEGVYPEHTDREMLEAISIMTPLTRNRVEPDYVQTLYEFGKIIKMLSE